MSMLCRFSMIYPVPVFLKWRVIYLGTKKKMFIMDITSRNSEKNSHEINSICIRYKHGILFPMLLGKIVFFQQNKRTCQKFYQCHSILLTITCPRSSLNTVHDIKMIDMSNFLYNYMAKNSMPYTIN